MKVKVYIHKVYHIMPPVDSEAALNEKTNSNSTTKLKYLH